MDAPRPHSLRQEWIAPPAAWAWPAAVDGLAMVAVCGLAPEANGPAIVYTGLMFGALAWLGIEMGAALARMWGEGR